MILLALLLAGAAPQEIPVDASGGVAVLIGAKDATVERLCKRGAWIAHVLEPDEARLKAARARIESAGFTGQAVAEVWTAAFLPHASGLANLVVAEDPRNIPESEILRVLAPGGAAWVRGREVRKPRAEGQDEWTHWRHGADGNMVSQDRTITIPTGVRWVAGPAQDVGGKKWYYDHILVSAGGRNIYVFEDALQARDAHNGALLWTRPFKAHTFRETGTPLPTDPPPDPKVRLGGRVSRVRPVAVGDAVYVVTGGKVLELDARTGATAAELGEAAVPREILVDGGKVIVSDSKSIRAWDAASRKPAWEAAVEARRMVAGDGALFAVTATHVVALDRATGKELWRAAEEEAPKVLTCTYHDGRLVLEKSTLRDDAPGCGIKVYDTKAGELAWKREYRPDMTHYREARAWFAQGYLWIQGDREKLIGLDPGSGSERKEWKTRGHHCAAPVASERFFMAPECDFTDFETGELRRVRLFKNACRLPFIPANGLLYTFPLQCECYPMLRGYMGLSSEKIGAPVAAGRREGPPAPAAAAPPPLLRPEEASAEWPTYRHDGWRSASTPVAVREELKKAWETPVAAPAGGPLAPEWDANPFTHGSLTPPVAAGGSVFVAAPDLHRLVALDAKTGRSRWTFTAGGRIDGPPTVAEGLCLFGCHDGWIYAVRAEDGVLAWRLRAAPREARIHAYGQLESPWPVVGSILVDGGLGFAAAGRHAEADGGLRVVAFRPRTGEIAWERTIGKLEDIKQWYGGTIPNTKIKVGLDYEPVDLLVKDGDAVAMSRWTFAPADGAMKLAVGSQDYKAGEVLVPRGLWGYGIRQTKMVAPKPPAAFDASGVRKGRAGDAAFILAAGKAVAVSSRGELRIGDAVVLTLESPPIRDGMIAAWGRLYVATEKGTLLCLE